MLGEGEIIREAQRVLPRLARDGAFIAEGETGEFGLYSPRNRWRKPILLVRSDVVGVFLTREFIRSAREDDALRSPAPGYECVFVLSDVGESFLRRMSRPSAVNTKCRQSGIYAWRAQPIPPT